MHNGDGEGLDENHDYESLMTALIQYISYFRQSGI